MALLRPIETIESRLSEIPIKIGQIIFCTDTNDIYMDNSENERTHMTDIIKLKTENDRDVVRKHMWEGPGADAGHTDDGSPQKPLAQWVGL